MKRRVISIFMVFVLTICTVFSTGFANAKSIETQPTTGSSELKRLEASGQLAALRELKASIAKGIKYKADDEVTIVVELEDKTLLEYADDNQDPEEFAASSKGKKAKKDILDKHNKVKSSIKQRVKNASYEESYEYTAIMNGFTLKARFCDLKAIKETSGVKNAYVAGYYEKPITQIGNEINMAYSTVTIGSDRVNADGYTGEGAVVAVLDSGLDYTHEAFNVIPEEVKYTIDDMNDMIAANSLLGIARSNKVIYSYDYADDDIDVMPNEGNEHGTHVSGTIAGNNGDDFKGVAPDAQLMMMKVFSDTDEYAYDDDQLAALEDAIILGADVINMSLGSPCGFTEDANEAMTDIYNRVGEAGISLMISAGNSYDQAYGTTPYDLPYADTPDYGVVGAPSTYESALSVASIENTNITANYFVVGDEKYCYTDNGPADKKLTTLAGKSYEYVPAGLGSPEECVAAGLNGKVALIQRGSLSFTEKVTNAYNNGAVAVIIFNHTDGTISMSVDNYYVPAVSITQEDGEAMVNAENKLVTFANEMGVFENLVANEMSDFSSWGCAPDLTLKPEITAPGGEIYSTMPGNAYASMSGTSMAAPHMAGAAAVLRQYVNENFELTNTEERDFINNLLMSTADPAEDVLYGGLYSPRKQGAGLVNVYDAINSGAYLYTGEYDRPKAELGDSEDGAFELSFYIKNYSEEEKNYEISAVVQTSYPDSDGQNMYDTLSGLSLEEEVDYTVSYTVGGESVTAVAVAPGEVQEVKVSFKLTEEVIEFLNKYFINGSYIEGFIFLTSEGEDVEDLSIPMLGFLGDWDGLQLFDGTEYDGNYYYYGSSVWGMFLYDGSPYYYDTLGENYFTGELDKNNIAYSKNRIRNEYGIDTDTWLTTDIGLLRNASDVTYTITNNATGEVVEKHSYVDKDCSKSFYYINGGFVTSMTDMEYLYGDFNGTELPDGDYTMTISGYAAEGDYLQSTSIDFYVDNAAPELTSAGYTKSLDGQTMLNTSAVDNNMVQGVDLYMIVKSKGELQVGLNVADMEYYTDLLFENGYIDEAAHDKMLELIPQPIINDAGQAMDWNVTGYRKLAEMFAPYMTLIFGKGYKIAPDYLAVSAIDYAWNTSSFNLVISHAPSGNISITVEDRQKNAVEGAVVEINGTEYTTGSDGTIELLDVDLGTYTCKLISVPEGYKMPNGATSFKLILDEDGKEASKTFKVINTSAVKDKPNGKAK